MPDLSGVGDCALARQLEGILKGHVRIDEAWSFVADTLKRAKDPDATIRELTGLDFRKVERRFQEKASAEGKGRSDDEIEAINKWAIAELFRLKDELLDTAASVIGHRYFLAGNVKVWSQGETGPERYLTQDQFRVIPGGDRIMYGQRVKAAVNDTPTHSWQMGYASIGETNAMLSGSPLQDRVLMMSDEDFEWMRASVLASYPPSALSLATDQHRQKTTAHADALGSAKYWDLATTLLWIGLRDIDHMADCDTYWRDSSHLQPIYRDSSPSDWISVYLNEGNHEPGVVKHANPKQALMDKLRSEKIDAKGHYVGESGNRQIDGDQWFTLDFCGGEFHGLIGGAGSEATQAGRIVPSIRGLLFNRESIVRWFPDPAHLPPPESISQKSGSDCLSAGRETAADRHAAWQKAMDLKLLADEAELTAKAMHLRAEADGNRYLSGEELLAKYPDLYREKGLPLAGADLVNLASPRGTFLTSPRLVSSTVNSHSPSTSYHAPEDVEIPSKPNFGPMAFSDVKGRTKRRTMLAIHDIEHWWLLKRPELLSQIRQKFFHTSDSTVKIAISDLRSRYQSEAPDFYRTFLDQTG